MYTTVYVQSETSARARRGPCFTSLDASLLCAVEPVDVRHHLPANEVVLRVYLGALVVALAVDQVVLGQLHARRVHQPHGAQDVEVVVEQAKLVALQKGRKEGSEHQVRARFLGYSELAA